MAVKPGTEIVRGSARKSIVPIPKKKEGDLAVRESRPPKIFGAVNQNEVAAAAERLRQINFENAKMQKAKKQEIFGCAKKGDWEPAFDWLEERDYRNINERDECGRTLLMIAASNGAMEAAMSLVAEDAYLGLTDEFDRSALIYALRNEHYELAKFLKSAGVKWEVELATALRDRKALLVKTMQRVLEISDEQVAAIEATLDPERGPALSSRLKDIKDDASALQDLTVMFQPDSVKAEASGGDGGAEHSAGTRQKKSFTSFRGC